MGTCSSDCLYFPSDKINGKVTCQVQEGKRGLRGKKTCKYHLGRGGEGTREMQMSSVASREEFAVVEHTCKGDRASSFGVPTALVLGKEK